MFAFDKQTEKRGGTTFLYVLNSLCFVDVYCVGSDGSAWERIDKGRIWDADGCESFGWGI